MSGSGSGVLVLNVGIYEVDVPYVAGQEGPEINVGDVTDSFNGTERNSIRAVKRTFTVTTGYLDATDEAALKTAIGNQKQIPCKGDLFNNSLAIVTCSVALTSGVVIQGISPLVRQLTLAVKFTTAT